MIEQFDHYISKSIRAYYKRRIIFPIIYLVFLLVLSIIYPMWGMIHPMAMKETDTLENLYNRRHRYISTSLENLYFTGYTKEWLDGTSGYYYYTMLGNDCIILLLDPDTCKQGLPVIEEQTIRCKIIRNSKSTEKLMTNLAKDLSWSEAGISTTVSSYMLSEPDATDAKSTLLGFLYLATGIYALASILVYLIYIIYPVSSRPCQALRAYGKPKDILVQAEEELATLPQLATEDMFITEHYFIETSNFGVAIVPIQEILWIYKYSTLHKFLWHHFSISYTLHITAKKRQYIHCPKNIKSDIDGIIDYLSEANHDILVGFSEENRLKIEEIQGDLKPIKEFMAFLSKKV